MSGFSELGGSVHVVPRPRRGGTSVRLTSESEPLPVFSEPDEHTDLAYGSKTLGQGGALFVRSRPPQRVHQLGDGFCVRVVDGVEGDVRGGPPGQDSDLFV